jgi:hypothetical protein
MSKIPSFEPNWKVEIEDVIGQNPEMFITIEETIARLKLIKEVGLANLHEKGVLVKDPYCSIYDMVSAIKNIPVSSGWPRQIPKFESGVRINRLKTSHKVWLTSLPMILEAYANVKLNKVSSFQQSQANPYFVNWAAADSWKEANMTIQTKNGDSTFCFVWYSISSTDDGTTVPFTMPEEWMLVKISESLVIDNVSYRTAFWVNENQANGEDISITINNTSTRRINCCLIDFWDYNSIPDFIMEYSGTGAQTVMKDFDEPYLWVVRSFEDDTDWYYMAPDGVRKNRIFNENIKQNLMFLDRDGKGERKISFDGSKTYSFFSLKLS